MRDKPPLWRRIARWTIRGIAVVVVLVFALLVIAYYRSKNVCDESHPTPANPMKAVVHCEYGPPQVLKVEAVERPACTDDQILVKVKAAAVNPLDWHFIRGTPYLMRMQAGMRYPKDIRVGVDFSGTVESVGKNVTRFQPGDDVFGGRDGAFAEYVCVSAERSVTRKPPNLSFAQAAAIPIAGVTALQGLRDRAQVQAGQKVLVNGASGGVGTFTVQIAKAMGAEVTGVCSTRNLEMVRSLGADHVIDYTKEDFTKGSVRYDAILDNVGNRNLLENKRVLAPEGRYVLIGGGGPDAGNWLGGLWLPLKALIASPFIHQQMGMFVAQLNKDDLKAIADLTEAGKVTPVIDRTYPLSQAAEAVRYLEEGHARGKVVLTIE